ncbi:AraC family transcriptional regulator [Pseudooceanicola sp. CBS1P-1]|uniref:Helix-turn-helix domain-containing protein n=1 Tax=Pseudooceanicola albus TaxID=2692189 RepID=A0A6L7FZ62_9RHOB|nr:MULTISPECIES: AraC family transcriptional regulator [Pseudooceanicola]MBT9383528.1 AraC family transcriptional regulator [Pseudooceanicola endophyticus]MXN17384.1 helix-turn-helix domain-containing protein [Pseudooceanicola albus]
MQHASTPQVLSAAATGMDRFIGRYGLCQDSFFGTLGLDPETLSAPTRQMDLGTYCRMMEYGAERTGDGSFGLAYGQDFTPQMLGLIGYIATSSANLGEAAQNLATFFPWHQQGTTTTLCQQDGLCWLSYRIDPARVAERRQDALVTMGMYCNVFRHAAGPGWSPELIDLEQPDCGDRAQIEAAFGAPVRFGQATNALVYRKADGARAMPGADAALRELLCCNLRSLGMAQAEPDTAARTAALIRENLSEPGLDLDFVAERLQMPRWTLQRRLHDAGTSFADLLEGERRRMAARYLAVPKLSVSVIAERLGYSEPSAFTRAFRRWEGVAPATYRRSTAAPLRH